MAVLLKQIWLSPPGFRFAIFPFHLYSLSFRRARALLWITVLSLLDFAYWNSL